jgi:hypothetical protein
MLPILDLKVNGCDDLLLIGDDLSLESDLYVSAFRCAERRCQSRFDDFVMAPEISAGIETLIQQYINEYTLSEIEQKISSSLQYHQLFSNTEFKIYIDQDAIDKNKLKVLIAFNQQNLSGADRDYTFSVVVNIENQRAFR